MVIGQGDIVWAELPEPTGSRPGFRRPLLVLQGDALNATRIETILCAPLTSNLRLGSAVGNVLLRASETGLPRDSVVNVSQVFPALRSELVERVATVRAERLAAVFDGIDVVLGRTDRV